jgi:hypothetical protein
MHGKSMRYLAPLSAFATITAIVPAVAGQASYSGMPMIAAMPLLRGGSQRRLSPCRPAEGIGTAIWWCSPRRRRWSRPGDLQHERSHQVCVRGEMAGWVAGFGAGATASPPPPATPSARQFFVERRQAEAHVLGRWSAPCWSRPAGGPDGARCSARRAFLFREIAQPDDWRQSAFSNPGRALSRLVEH